MKRSDTVIIYGSGPSLRVAKFPNSSDNWAVGTLFGLLGDRIDLYFCMHDGESVDAEYIGQGKYPLDKIMNKYGRSYFTNTISYMIAYAIYLGYKEISFCGVDVDLNGEYGFERASLSYWCGIAEANGIKVNWDALDPCFLYGYDGEKMEKVLGILNKHKETASAEFTAEKDPAKKLQWAGYLTAINTIIQEIIS